MKSKNYKEPEDHYGDNPADETQDYEGPQIDMSDPRQSFDDGTISEYYRAMNNVASRQKPKTSRGSAAGRMMED